MPIPAPSTPPAERVTKVPYRRTYHDVLGRPMIGRATITGSITPGDPVNDSKRDLVIAVAVTVEITEGVLTVELPPDTYRIDALLRTKDGHRVSHSDTVTLTA